MTTPFLLLEQDIQHAMGDVRGARTHPERADTVDDTLSALRERAEQAGAGEPLTRALANAGEAFRTGDTVTTVQQLSRALLHVSREQTRGRT